MKKIYMTPEMQTVELNVKQLIMTSVPTVTSSGLTGTNEEEYTGGELDW